MASDDHKPVLRSNLESDPEIAEIVDRFVAELPDRVALLLGAHREGDVVRVRTLAHQLKGAAGGYGFPTIGAAAKQLEECLRQGATGPGHVEQIRSGVEELVELCRQASRSGDGKND